MFRKSVFVLGHRGMLGHVVVEFLKSKGCSVITSPQRYLGIPFDPLLTTVRNSGCPWVINAIGAVKQRAVDQASLFLVNTVLPVHLVQELGAKQRLIHASTDCVFSGERGHYAVDDPKDANDLYGLSKALGEQISLDPRVAVFRVSIIGPEADVGHGLLGWFLRQEGEVSGYTNHVWNGITTLEWARAAWELMQGRGPKSSGTIQLGVAEDISKHDLLCMCAEVWDRHGVVVKPCAMQPSIDRSLQPDWVRPSLKQQLIELRAWISREISS